MVLSVVLLAAGITLMLVVHILVVLWVLRRGITARVAEHAEEDAGLTAEELGELPCHDFKDGGAGECAVCLEAFMAGDRCMVLPRCEHGFHAECVGSWLRKSRLCPICRAEVAGPPKEDSAVASEVVVEIVAA
ncbi:RING-H2 finger protein ATL60-like [Hordeum vulgare subsp. vulgare]|uniref:RING-H2 finger protein ATL60-like n=1 Tax=Hordeum vulgare subsp. vulgare TaxID=112509 RepID=UPI001D1A404D|nr:RING-H2 finger protein ATL60-like [Hordeum vulgare subsp. vulgare]